MVSSRLASSGIAKGARWSLTEAPFTACPHVSECCFTLENVLRKVRVIVRVRVRVRVIVRVRVRVRVRARARVRVRVRARVRVRVRVRVRD